jgi:hypothetical protein
MLQDKKFSFRHAQFSFVIIIISVLVLIGSSDVSGSQQETPEHPYNGSQVLAGKEGVSATEAVWNEVFTFQIEAYTATLWQAKATYEFSGNIPSPLSLYYTSHGTVQDFNLEVTGGGACTHDADNRRVNCSGDLDTITMSFRTLYDPQFITGSRVLHEYYFYSNLPIDFTMNIFYPTTLTFAMASLEPDIQTSTHLQWNSEDMEEFELSVTFVDPTDPTIRQVFLPLINR